MSSQMFAYAQIFESMEIRITRMTSSLIHLKIRLETQYKSKFYDSSKIRFLKLGKFAGNNTGALQYNKNVYNHVFYLCVLICF